MDRSKRKIHVNFWFVNSNVNLKKKKKIMSALDYKITEVNANCT